MKILIVDNDNDSRVLLEQALMSKKYDVIRASNGVEALRNIKVSPPDLIISDISMPEIDGFELCKRVKSDENLSHIPFIFYTATYIDKTDEDLAMSLGASGFLRKPLKISDFLIKLEEVIQEHLSHKLSISEQPLTDLAKMDRIQLEALARKLDQRVHELEKEKEAIKRQRSEWEEVLRLLNSTVTILDIEHNILSANNLMVKIIGVNSEKDLIGKKCYEIFHNSSEPPENCPVVKMLASGLPEEIEMEALGKFFHVVCTPIFGNLNRKPEKVVHVATDITKQKSIEKALVESEENYRRLFQNHAAAKLLIDPDTGNIVDANKSAVNFYGWSEAELKKMKIQDINTLPPEQVKAEMEKARTLEKTYFDFSHRLKDGSIKNVRVFSSRVNLKGKDYLHSIIYDVTKEKELEAHLFQSQKLESIGNLASGIAHDFNNMLNVILGYGEHLLNKLHHGDPLRKDIQQIVEAASRSMSLTQQLLAFSRKQILQPKTLNINETLKSMQNMLQRLIGEDIELVMHLQDDVYNVKADPAQIDQVIMNLAANARDAMPFGGKLILETANVFLDEHYIKNHPGVTSGEYVMIAVTDTGYGMDKETLSHIFEPFFTTKGKQKGTGLGLATVYGIVKQSEGHIWVYSEPGKGTTFKIYIPAVFIETKDQPQEKQIETVTLKGEGKHILLVEDELALRELFDKLLTGFGYQVTVASNGGEALLLVEEKGLRPDIVITDVIMPIMSGAMLIERLKKTLPDIKVLYMSGYTDNAIVHHGVLDKGIPFIQKPFNINELASKIGQLLRTEK